MGRDGETQCPCFIPVRGHLTGDAPQHGLQAERQQCPLLTHGLSNAGRAGGTFPA